MSLVPAATCLTQALTAQTVLSRRGHDSRLRIGVAKDTQGNLEAHAWVECDGTVVVGESEDMAGLAVMPPLDLNGSRSQTAKEDARHG